MTDWNPNLPEAMGLEVFPRDREFTGDTGWPSVSFQPTTKQLASTTAAWVQTLDSTVTETIDFVYPYMMKVDSGTYLLWEALTAGQEVATGHGTQLFRPNLVTGISNAENQTGSTAAANLLASINEVILDETTWVTATGVYGTTPSGRFDLEFPTAGALAGKRITGITAYFVIGRDPASAGSTVICSLSPPLGLATLWGNGTASTGVSTTASVSSGEINQATNQPWTVAEIQAFDAGNGIRLSSFAPGVFIYQVWIEVAFCDENRVARSCFSVQDSVAGPGPHWYTVPVEEPDGTSGWSKVNGSNVAMILRQPILSSVFSAEAAVANVPLLQTVGTQPLYPGLTNLGGAVVGIDGTLTSTGLALLTRLSGFVLSTSISTQSIDSQPYCRVIDNAVTSAQYLEQDLQGAVGTFAGLSVPFRMDSSSGDLIVTLIRRSDSVVMETGTLTASDALLLPYEEGDNWKRGFVEFSSPVVLGAVRYGVVISTTAGGEWWFPSWTNLDGNPDWLSSDGRGGIATYSGETDRMFIDATSDLYADLAVLLVEPVDPIVGLAVSETSIPTDATGECPVTGIGILGLSWTASALGAAFERYEIQRYDADPSTSEWVTIALLTDETVPAFSDVEARLGVVSCYRVRVVQSPNNIWSEWSAEECGTAPVDGCELTFTTNELNEDSIAYADVYDRDAKRDYDFPEAKEVQVRQLYGRNFQVAFHPTERRGVEFQRTLFLAGLVVGGKVGPSVGDALRDLAVAPVSYICVRDSDGNRWFGSIRVPSMSVRQPGAFHWADLVFIETTSVPSAPDVVPLDPFGPFFFVDGQAFLLISGDQLQLT